MRLKWKYFLILLAVGLAPLVVLTTISRHSVQVVSSSVSERAAGALTELLTRELSRSAHNSARAVVRDKITLEYALSTLAARAGDALSAPAPDAEVYFSADYADPKRAPGDLIEDERYVRAAASGETRHLPVSFDHQVFVLAPGVSQDKVAKDVNKLAATRELMRAIFEDLGDIVFRIHISLDSGVTAVYPGYGGYPENFDPRQAPWYRQARSRHEPVWSSLFVSTTTWQTFFSVTMPVSYDNGRFAGVAALDVPLNWFLQESELNSLWSEKMRSFLVYADRDPQTGEQGLRVVAQKDYQKNARLLVGREYEWLDGPEGSPFARFVAKVAAGESGTVSMEFRGEESVWAYAPQSDNLRFVLVVPRSVALALPEKLRSDVLRLAGSQLGTTVFVSLAVLAVVGLAAFYGARATTRPILAMVDAWRKLGRGDFSVRLDIACNDERDRLVQAFNETVPMLKDRFNIRRDLALAEEVQQSLLPETLPEIEGFGIAGTSLYCDETGGDYFDAYCEDETAGRYALIVGDVSGHGVASALLMASVRAMFKVLSATRLSLAERVSEVNRRLADDVEQSGSFMTIFVLEFEAATAKGSFVRAGHDPALLLDPETGEFEELTGKGPALGFSPGATYQETAFSLNKPGAVLVVGTDGIWESENDAGELYGKTRFMEVVKGAAEGSASEIVAAVLDDVALFRGSAPVTDDVTLAVVKKLPA